MIDVERVRTKAFRPKLAGPLAWLVLFLGCSDGSGGDQDDADPVPTAGTGSSIAGASGAVGASVGGTGGVQGSSSGSGSGASGSAASSDPDAGTQAPPDSECVVVQLLDCCPVYRAVTRTQLEADRCLVALPFGPTFGTDQLCASTSCVGIACKVPPPPSRVAVPDGAGGCRFADECVNDEDCAIGWAASGCCSCPHALPEVLLDTNPCALRAGELPDPADDCRACTAPVQCGQCSPPPAPHCVMGDELRVCE